MIKRLLNKTRKMDFTEGNTVKNIWVLALPIMIASILQTAFNVVDMIWVGRLGPEAIAAVAMSGAVLLVVVAFVIGVSTGTQSLIARFTGARNYKSAENIAMQALIIGAITSTILTVVGFIFAESILSLLGATGAILEQGAKYLKIVLVGSPAMVYLFLVNAIFRASGDTLTPMLIMIGATVLNVILDPLMIFGIGFPRMGVAGAALATALSRGLGALVGVYILFNGYSRIRVHLRQLRFDFKAMGKILKIGLPDSVQMALRSSVGLILMAIVAQYGSYALAAYGIGLRIFSIVLLPGFALATSAAMLVGQNLGAQKLSRARTCAWQAAGFNMLLMGVAGIIFFIFSTQLIAIFSSDTQIVELGSKYLKITSLSYIFVAQGLVLGRSLMGAGDAVSPMLISCVALLGIQIPLAMFLPNHLHIGLSGIWWAILFSSVLQGIFTTFWFSLSRWKLRKV